MTSPARLPRRLAAAVLVAAAAGAGAVAAPASAAACAAGSGVTVVVDFHQLGGGVVQKCDADGAGKTAQHLFEDNGFSLAYVQRQPGFVCRVDNMPSADDEACVNTPPTDAYWGLFWADGTSASWKYSTLGVGGLTLKSGQSVAFSWQGSAASTPPGVAPPHTSKPSASASPTDKPSAKPSAPGSSAPAAPTSSASAASPTASASGKPEPSTSGRPSTSATGSASPSEAESSSPSASAAAAAASTDPGAGGGSGLPGWALPAVLVALVATGAVTAYVRRPSAGPTP